MPVILAQITEGTKLAGQIITESAGFGPITYILIVFLIMVSVERFLNFWFIARPESIDRRETEKSIAVSLNMFATNATATTAILQQMVNWQEKIDSGIRELNGNKCQINNQTDTRDQNTNERDRESNQGSHETTQRR